MQPPPVQKHNNLTPTHPSHPLENPSTTSLFQPFKPPLRKSALVQTTVRMVVFLLAVIACAATAVWWFLPSQLPWLP
jgi:hypothetical protein